MTKLPGENRPKTTDNSVARKFEREPLGIPATGGPPACRVVDSPYAL